MPEKQTFNKNEKNERMSAKYFSDLLKVYKL